MEIEGLTILFQEFEVLLPGNTCFGKDYSYESRLNLLSWMYGTTILTRYSFISIT